MNRGRARPSGAHSHDSVLTPCPEGPCGGGRRSPQLPGQERMQPFGSPFGEMEAHSPGRRLHPLLLSGCSAERGGGFELLQSSGPHLGITFLRVLSPSGWWYRREMGPVGSMLHQGRGEADKGKATWVPGPPTRGVLLLAHSPPHFLGLGIPADSRSWSSDQLLGAPGPEYLAPEGSDG